MADTEEDETIESDDLETEDGEGDTETTEEEAPTAEELKELREKAAKVDDIEADNKQVYERLRKLGYDKDGKPIPKRKVEADTSVPALTPQDVLVLTKANVHEDDLETVMEYAAFKKITLSAALKDSTLKTILNGNEEVRKTAEATITRGGPRGTADVTGESLLQKAEQTGEVPTDTVGMNKIFLARQERRLNNRPKRRT